MNSPTPGDAVKPLAGRHPPCAGAPVAPVAADPARLLLAAHPKLVTPVLQVVPRVITRHLFGQSGLKADEAVNGVVTLVQRFGSAANLNIHLRCLVLDGVYRHTLREPQQAALHKIIAAILEQPAIEKILTHLGLQRRARLGACGWMTGSFAALNQGWRKSATGRPEPLTRMDSRPVSRPSSCMAWH